MVILLVALIVIGPKKLPDAAKQLGRAIHEFRRVSGGMRQDLQDALGVDDLRSAFDLNRLLGDDSAEKADPPLSGPPPIGDIAIPAPDGFPPTSSVAAAADGESHLTDVPPPPDPSLYSAV